MSKRKIIEINDEKCVGCGKCVNACVGGALALVDGKAKLMREDYCDGLGVCIGNCPFDAITFKEVEVTPQNAYKPNPNAPKHSANPEPETSACSCPSTVNKEFKAPTGHTGCPGTAAQSFTPEKEELASGASALEAWPVQLHLIRPEAPQFQNADILIAASCSAFSCGSFHKDILAGKGLVIACPKLDRLDGYADKLEDFFRHSNPKSVTIARMEVPCCSGLTNMVTTARQKAGSTLPVKEITIGLQGDILREETI